MTPKQAGPQASHQLNPALRRPTLRQRRNFKFCSSRCLRNQAPTYLADRCIPVSEVAGRQHIRSARRQQLNVPRVRRVIGRRAFASAGPTVWNSLPDNLRDSTVGPDQFRELKLICLPICLIFRRQCVRSFFYVAALYKFTFTYLLTYLLLHIFRESRPPTPGYTPLGPCLAEHS